MGFKLYTLETVSAGYLFFFLNKEVIVVAMILGNHLAFLSPLLSARKKMIMRH